MSNKKNFKKLAKAVAFSLMLGSAFMPVGVNAATTYNAAQITQGQKVNFGNYYQSKKVDNPGETKTNYNKDAITWKVLGTDTGTISLWSDKALHGTRNGSFVWNNPNSTDYTKSQIRTWLIGEFTNDAFSAAEQAMLRDSTITSITGSGNEQTTDKVYLLAISDIDATNYPLFADVQRTDYAEATNTAMEDLDGDGVGGAYVWLRDKGTSANQVREFASGHHNLSTPLSKGFANIDSSKGGYAIVPGTTLKTDNILFATDADGGKSTAAANPGTVVKFNEITDTSTLDLTISDVANAKAIAKKTMPTTLRFVFIVF